MIVLEIMMLKSVRWLGLWWGCGRLPRAPGTWGTVGAIPLVWVAQIFLSDILYLVFGWALAALSMVVAQVYVDHFSKGEDPQEFVLDEVAGFAVAMTWVPFEWRYVLAGFILFRILDVLKPFPISYIDQKVKGGIGVVADDLMAGILANVVLQVVVQKGIF